MRHRLALPIVCLVLAMHASFAAATTPEELTATAKLLAVDNLATYEPAGGVTKCNFFVQDFAKTILGEVPDELTGLANEMFVKLEASDQWTAHSLEDATTTFTAAQSAANEGKFVIVAYKNADGHGHIGVIVPSKEAGGAMNSSGQWGMTVPFLAQAGTTVFDYEMMSFGFKPDLKDKMKIFIRN